MFFTFVGGAPHVVVDHHAAHSAEYGVWFMVISLAYMAGNFAAGRWSAKYGVDFMIRAGVAVTVLGAAVGIGWVLLEPWRGPEVIMTPQMIIGFASGFMLPNAIAGAVSVRRRRRAPPPADRLHADGARRRDRAADRPSAGRRETALPLAAIVLVLCACALVAFFALVRK
jgi:DHA1 family bicyclomycin/chloramphenicol resistance-like MFS transporter